MKELICEFVFNAKPNIVPTASRELDSYLRRLQTVHEKDEIIALLANAIGKSLDLSQPKPRQHWEKAHARVVSLLKEKRSFCCKAGCEKCAGLRYLFPSAK